MRANLTTEGLSDFNRPLEMLKACHERVEEQIEALHELAAHLGTHGCDEHAQQAAVNAMRYFDTAGRLHYEDEERDVFPSLREAALGLNAGRVALLMTLGSAAGGYGLARLAQHLSQRVVRNTIIVIGLTSAIWLMRR